jgi:hypothetical protein
MKQLIAILAGIALAFSFSGCASTDSTDSAARNELIAQAAVVYGVAKVVENNPTYGPRIAAIAAEVRAVAKGESFGTVDLLMQFIRAKIDFEKLAESPADAALVNLLLDAVQIELVARLGEVQLPAEKMLVVEKVAGWIENAAIAATPPA